MNAIMDDACRDARREFAGPRDEFNTIKWMLATNLTLTLLVLGKLLPQ
ncbi:hypothetical protein V3H18_15595 [Methylocystis sp. 9N]|uniref:Uncharacterized protein n=1 Tax=Methylocystis borbori TaxID=3118750 RepID=A0ABU7XN20_9HYPH